MMTKTKMSNKIGNITNLKIVLIVLFTNNI